MEFLPVAQCAKDLDFRPRRPYPEALYPYAYKGQLLCGFTSLKKEAILCDENPQDLFFSLFPELSLAELARLKQCIATAKWDWNLEKLFAYYGYHWNEQLSRVIAMLVELPKEFQDWSSDKSLGAKDFYPLLVTQPTDEALIELARMQPSKSEGVQILELTADLSLQEKQAPEITQQRKPAEYLSELRALRYPMREQSRQKRKKLTAQLSWPKSSEVKWNAMGDKQKLEFRTSWDSKESLEKSVHALQHVIEQLSEESKNPWK